MVDKLYIEIENPGDPDETISFTSNKMKLLHTFLYGDYTFLTAAEKEIKDDIENDRHPGFLFLNTKLMVKDHYFTLKYNIFCDMDEAEEKRYSSISLFATQSEFFRLAKEFSEIDKKIFGKK